MRDRQARQPLRQAIALHRCGAHRARVSTDPTSVFGGIIAFNREAGWCDGGSRVQAIRRSGAGPDVQRGSAAFRIEENAAGTAAGGTLGEGRGHETRGRWPAGCKTVRRLRCSHLVVGRRSRPRRRMNDLVSTASSASLLSSSNPTPSCSPPRHDPGHRCWADEPRGLYPRSPPSRRKNAGCRRPGPWPRATRSSRSATGWM